MNLTTSAIMALIKVIPSPKGFDTAITKYELNTNRSHIQLGPIRPFMSSHYQKQIIVLTVERKLIYRCTAMYAERKHNDDPLVKIKYASTSQHYDYLQRIPVYHMQIIVRMTLIYSNLSM